MSIRFALLLLSVVAVAQVTAAGLRAEVADTRSSTFKAVNAAPAVTPAVSAMKAAAKLTAEKLSVCSSWLCVCGCVCVCV